MQESTATEPLRRLEVAELAAACELSAGFLSRVLKAATGRSPHAYQLERRLLHARRKFIGGTAPVLQCGFASHAHLTATLRCRLGVTPSALRGEVSARTIGLQHPCSL